MTQNADADYRQIFTRNEGVFAPHEQQRLKDARVLVVGCGGIGSFVAACLARAGVGHFTLVDFDSFDVTNLNRQICATHSTIGSSKAAVLKTHIADINSHAVVHSYARLVPLDEYPALIAACDLVFPAADDFAFSLMLFNMARSQKKNALIVVPAGMWAITSILSPQGATAWDITGLPECRSYDEAKKLITSKEYIHMHRTRAPKGLLRPEYLEEFYAGKKPPAQICPVVWTASSIGAFETVKLLSGKGPVIRAPQLWELTPHGVTIRRAKGISLYAIRLAMFRRQLRRALKHSASKDATQKED